MNTPYYSGIITNYVCTAACRHCMFGSSPSCPKDFITADEAERTAALLREAGTTSVHIGGGEPHELHRSSDADRSAESAQHRR